MATRQAPPPPPRFTGNIETDFTGLVQYLQSLHTSLLVDFNANQDAGGGVDPSDLPDPATSTIAQAQQTANEAYLLAQDAQENADAVEAIVETFGTVQIADAATTVAITFGTPQPDTAYSMVLTAESFAGTPAAGSFTVKGQTKAVGSCTIEVLAAPGGGNGVTFAWHLRRAVA